MLSIMYTPWKSIGVLCVLLVAILLTFAACGSTPTISHAENSAATSSQNVAGQSTSSAASNSNQSNPNASATQVQSGDQQVQDLLKSLDNAQKDEKNADANSSENNPNP